MSPNRYLVTSALPYANGPLHLGHVAGAYLSGDVFCRYQRLRGQDVLYICGSDEHGVAILMRARQDGVEPQEIVDRYHARIEAAFGRFGMSFDWYGRTSDPIHHETSAQFFRDLAQKGAFVTRTDEQLYDAEAGLFLADRFVVGTCPKCGNENAYGDQCESCGTTLSPSELVDPRSTLTDSKPELRETTHWYLPLGRHQDALTQWIESREDWKPNVLGQIKSWLVDGLGDRAMTRDLPWGVSVPADVAAAEGVDATGKVLYVWFDAPLGYISATRAWAASTGEPDAWKRWWQDDETSLVHFIGKDNIVFHCLIFPLMLQLHGDYVLPKDVPANEFLNLEGQKLSTSRGWAVWLDEALDAFPADTLRYALCATMPEAKDADFSWKDFQARVNNELADTFGNLVHRCMTFAARSCGGVVPPLEEPSAADRDALASLANYPEAVGRQLERYHFRDALAEAMSLARKGNKYFNDQEPWKTKKSDPRACANTIHVSLQIVASLSVLLDPFLPFSCAKIRELLAIGALRRGAEDGLSWDDAGRPLLSAGTKLGEPEPLFPKIEDAAIQEQLDKLEASAAASNKAASSGAADDASAPFEPVSETIQFDDFAKIDLRIGTVLRAERMKKSKRLLRCDVDLGFETRQVLAGVAEHMTPEELVGRRVVVVANLAPRKMMGTESQGMLLMAEGRDGRLVPVGAEQEPGSTVR